MSRRIVILDSNYIRAFGVCGPITTPTPADDSTILNLINAGHKVYEKLTDGSSKRLTRANFELVTADKIKPADKVEPVVTSVKTSTEEVKVETPALDEGKVFNGVSATTAATLPEKTEEAPDTVATTKAQRRAQKKAKLEAAKDSEE